MKMKMKRLVVLALFIASPAFAQQHLTPQQQAAANLGSQLGLVMQQNAELMGQIQQLGAQIAEKDALIKKLKDKYEPKPVVPTEEKK